MESVRLLKQEINDTFASIHDLVKWKLAVCAVLGAAALGLNTSGDKRQQYYLLLLFIPFVCAYIDLYCYQYQIRILVIARFLRRQTTDAVLRQYELWCTETRKTGAFGLWHLAGASATAVMSFAAVVAAWVQFRHAGRWANLGFALLLVIVAWTVIALERMYNLKAELLDQAESESEAIAKAAAAKT